MGGFGVLLFAAGFCGSVDMGGGGGGCEAWGAVALFGLMGAAGGAIIGTGVGLAIKGGGEWQQIPLDRLRVSFAPRRDGFALGLTVWL